MKRLLLCVLLVGVSLFVGCGGSGGGSNPPTPPPAVTLQSIQVTPATPSITAGKTQQFTATGSYSDGTTKDLTATANWLSATTSVATINISGLATAVAAGTSSISATSGTIVGTTTLTVVNPLISITVTPASATVVPPTGTQQFTATGKFADGTTQDITATATWQSSGSVIASVNAAGLATGLTPGTVTITATSGSVSGTASLTVTNPLVSITVTPANSSVAAGTKPQFVATGTYFDGTSNVITSTVTWSSSNPTAATISNSPGLQGEVTALAAGTTTITATLSSVSGTTTLTVTNATVTKIDVSPQSAPISLFLQQQYTALGTFSDGSQQDITNVAAWTSSDPTKVTITTSGLATGIAVTTTPVTITATYKGISGTATVTVDTANLVSIAITPNNFTLAQGTSRQFAATGTFTNGSTLNVTNQATWISSNTAIATVGLHTGQVKAAPTVSSPSNPVTITVTLGTVTQTITVDVTNTTPQFITVTPIAATIPAGTNQLFSATATFKDGSIQDVTRDSTWSSSDTTVATVAITGLLFAKAPGTATVTATFGGQSGTAQLTVSTATLVSIAVSPPTATLAPGSTMSFQANGTYSDGSTVLLSALATWSSSAPSVASVTPGLGIVTGQSAGTATITATYQGKSGSANVLVTSSALTSISVTPPSGSVPEAVSTQFTAIGTFADSSTQNLTNSVTWASSAPAIGTISNAFGKAGIATGVAPGTTSITAVFAGKTGTATLTVNTLALVSIAVTPTNPTVTHGGTQPFTATGTFSDGSTINLSSQVTWSSSTPTVATINTAGTASAISVGTTNITAAFTQSGSPVIGTTVMTVN